MAHIIMLHMNHLITKRIFSNSTLDLTYKKYEASITDA